MDQLWRTALWQQLGAAIDVLENAMLVCPSALWRGILWRDHSDDPLPPEYASFWNITYHTLFWLDLSLTGSLEGFAPPAPFTLNELDPAGVLPEQTYTKDELHTYLMQMHQKCRTTIAALTDEAARRPVDFAWTKGGPASYLEHLLYTMRHIQELASQLNLFLGHNGVDVDATSWVSRAKADRGKA